MTKRRILILCTGNSCRSQMAEALVRDLAEAEWEAHSAGTRPAGYVHRYAIAAMAEVGIDIAAQRSKSVTEFADQSFDYVVTVCDAARKECPAFPGASKTLHWPLDDPAAMLDDKDAGLAVARRVRDELRCKLAALIREDHCKSAEAMP
ncbi:MAG: arsenate reductase ArsC [Phycisphaerae bacterium]